MKANGFFYAIIGGILSIFLTKDIPRENARLIALCIPIAVLMSLHSEPYLFTAPFCGVESGGR